MLLYVHSSSLQVLCCIIIFWSLWPSSTPPGKEIESILLYPPFQDLLKCSSPVIKCTAFFRMSPLCYCHSSSGFIGLAVVAVACLLAPHMTGPCWVPRWRTQTATLTCPSPNSDRWQRSTQPRYGTRSSFPRHGRSSHPWVASGQLKHRITPAQLVTSQQSDVRNTAVAYTSAPFLSPWWYHSIPYWKCCRKMQVSVMFTFR